MGDDIMATAERVLNADQAARMLYRTSSPTPDQVEKIKQKIERGVLRRSQRGGCTTTTAGIAEYMARYTIAAGQSDPRKRSLEVAEPETYRAVLQDCFLAVLLQRTHRKRSSFFNAVVVTLQIALVILPLVILYGTYQGSLRALIKSPERAAVESWLSQEYDAFEIESFAPQATADEQVVRVKFWYANQGQKRIQSLRLFTVHGDRVTHVTMPD
jgi:hypothetical protein